MKQDCLCVPGNILLNSLSLSLSYWYFLSQLLVFSKCLSLSLSRKKKWGREREEGNKCRGLEFLPSLFFLPLSSFSSSFFFLFFLLSLPLSSFSLPSFYFLSLSLLSTFSCTLILILISWFFSLLHLSTVNSCEVTDFFLLSYSSSHVAWGFRLSHCFIFRFALSLSLSLSVFRTRQN